MIQNEADLVEAFRGDPQMFAAVHDRYFRDIYRYVAGRLDVQTAEDIAAETFLQAFDQRDRFDPERGALRPWLFGIATNLVYAHRRKEARHLRALSRLPVEPAADSHENRVVTSVAAQRLMPSVARALAGLPRGERDVVLLLSLGQLTYEEAAQALGVSPGTVGSRLNRARTKLRQVIEKENDHG